MLLINVFIKKLMEKAENNKNFTAITGALFLKLTCCDTKTHTKKPHTNVCMFTQPNIIVTLFLIRYINKLTNLSFQ